MNCPICNIALQMTERQGVEIDYCPKCRGVWLDRGELDKIIEKSALPSPALRQEETRHAPEKYQEHDDHHGYRHGYKKKKSFLSELFD